jgi:hypothetical protein
MLKEERIHLAEEATVSEVVPLPNSAEEFQARMDANPEIMEAFLAGDPQGTNDFFEKVWGMKVISTSERIRPE